MLLVAPAAAAGPPPKPSAKSAPSAHARATAPGKTAKLEARARRASPGRSVGSPTEGHLVGGAHLSASQHVRIVPFYVPGDSRWGLEGLVTLIDRAARAVRRQFPDAVLSVGHLSRPGGGEIDRHASHESGRDADIGFYVKNHLNKPVYADHFVPFKGDGTAPSWPGARFDDARNWAFVASVAGSSHVRVSHVFVATPIRTRLLQYAEKIKAPPAIRARAAALMVQPRGSLPHDDHFHVRISCPPASDRGADRCVELPKPRKRAPDSAVARAHGSGKPAPAASPPGHGAPRPAPPPARPTPRAEEPEASKSDSFIPSLAPMVPGLDSVVIPTPLEGLGPKPGGRPAAPDEAPIDDPDGVLEAR